MAKKLSDFLKETYKNLNYENDEGKNRHATRKSAKSVDSRRGFVGKDDNFYYHPAGNKSEKQFKKDIGWKNEDIQAFLDETKQHNKIEHYKIEKRALEAKVRRTPAEHRRLAELRRKLAEEKLDEISPEILGRYVSKAYRDITPKPGKYIKGKTIGDRIKRYNKRIAGLGLAAKKIHQEFLLRGRLKEEESLDEVSPEKLMRYSTGAFNDLGGNAKMGFRQTRNRIKGVSLAQKKLSANKFLPFDRVKVPAHEGLDEGKWLKGKDKAGQKALNHSLNPFSANHERVLRQTLRMNDVMARVMGGPSKEEARKVLKSKFGYSDKRIAKLEENLDEVSDDLMRHYHGEARKNLKSLYGKRRRETDILKQLDYSRKIENRVKGTKLARDRFLGRRAKPVAENLDEAMFRPSLQYGDTGENDGKRYKVVRYHFNGGNKTIARGLTLGQARYHTGHPETSSKTAKERAGRRYTAAHGQWFDGYAEDKRRR